MNTIAPKIIAIVGMDSDRVIGWKNQLPWKIPEDMKRFAALTTGHTVLMGRKTFESIPAKFRPLPNRKNIVVTRDPKSLQGVGDVEVRSDPVQYVSRVKNGSEKVVGDILWIIGGEQIYSATANFWDEISLTLIDGTHQGDAFFPDVLSQFTEIESTPGPGCKFIRLIRS